MMITATFESIQEMREFANAVSTVETDALMELANGPDHYRQANPTIQFTGTPPVQQAASVTPPVQQAPVTPPPVQQTPVTPPVQQSVPVTPPPVQPAPVQTTAPSYTPDDLARAAMTLMDSGRQGDLINLLAQFGADTLTHLQPEQYGAFATALRGLGAPI